MAKKTRFGQGAWRRIQRIGKAFGLPFPGHQYAYDIHPVGGPWWNGVNGKPVSADTNSIVSSVVRWAGRTFPEAPVRVWTRSIDDETVVHNHPLALLFEQPNPYYGAPTMWKAVLADYILTGNAYLKIARGERSFSPLELWWIPSVMIEPMWESDESFIDYYAYWPQGEKVRIENDDVIHFRDGMDPENPRKGKSGLASVLGEIMTDIEAQSYTRTILANLGVPGVLLSPDTDTYLSDEELEAIRDRFEERFKGVNRGRPMVMTAKTNVQMLSFSPEQLNLKELRRVPEERITAVLGLPAIIAGLGAGLDRSTFSNYEEARVAAWKDFLLPLQRDMAGALQTQFLPQFGQDIRTHRVGFDVSRVAGLQEDENTRMTRLVAGVSNAILTPMEARKILGYGPPAVAEDVEAANHLFIGSKVAPLAPTQAMLDQQAHQEELALASEERQLEASTGGGGGAEPDEEESDGA